MARKRRRRQAHGSAWHWKQTNCWYYTLPGTKRRMALFDEDGQRIRGKERKEAAELALARVKLADSGPSPAPAGLADWLVAKVCSDYLQHYARRVLTGTMSQSYHSQASQYLNA